MSNLNDSDLMELLVKSAEQFSYDYQVANPDSFVPLRLIAQRCGSRANKLRVNVLDVIKANPELFEVYLDNKTGGYKVVNIRHQREEEERLRLETLAKYNKPEI